MVFVIIWEMFHGRVSLNSVLLLLLVSFVSGFRLELIYISLTENIRSSFPSSPWFSAACVATIVYRNHFFHLYQKDKSSESKVKFRQASKRWTGFLKLPNLHILTKQRSLSLPRNLALGTFGELPIMFSTKVNLLYLFNSTVQRYCLLHLIKQNFLL